MQLASEVIADVSEEILGKGHRVRVRVTGGSMYPFIRGGEVIHLERAIPSQIRPMDIILYRDSFGRPIVHRVIGKYPDGGSFSFITKGDSSSGDDGRVAPSRISGRVVAVEKGDATLRIDGGASRFANTVYGRSLPAGKWVFYILFAPLHLRARIRDRTDGKRREEIFMRSLMAIGSDAEAEDAFAEQIRNGPDWECLLNRLEAEGLTALAYHHIGPHRDGLPAPVRTRLEQAYHRQSAKNIITCQKAREVIGRLRARGAGAIILKGVFLAEAVYEEIGLRPMTDIDILIAKEDLAVANDVLRGMGYPEPPRYRDLLAYSDVSGINSLMYVSGSPLTPAVHIHWHLINSTWPLEKLVGAFDMRRIWDAAVPCGIDGLDAMTLSPGHQIIYLAHHGLHHGFDRLIRAADVVKAMSYYKDAVDAELLREESAVLGIEGIVSGALADISRYFDMGREPARIRGGYARSYLAYLMQEKGIPAKFSFVWRTIFPPSIVVSHVLGLPLNKVGPMVYLRRFFAHLLGAVTGPRI